MINKIKKIIHEILETIGETDDIAEIKSVTEKTVLMGEGGVLDSASLIFMVSELEERIEGEFGKKITIADESMFSRKSPFQNVGALADYLLSLLEKRD